MNGWTNLGLKIVKGKEKLPIKIGSVWYIICNKDDYIAYSTTGVFNYYKDFKLTRRDNELIKLVEINHSDTLSIMNCKSNDTDYKMSAILNFNNIVIELG